MFRREQICSGESRYVQERAGMFRREQVCLGVSRYVQERADMSRIEEVCSGESRYVRRREFTSTLLLSEVSEVFWLTNKHKGRKQ